MRALGYSGSSREVQLRDLRSDNHTLVRQLTFFIINLVATFNHNGFKYACSLTLAVLTYHLICQNGSCLPLVNYFRSGSIALELGLAGLVSFPLLKLLANLPVMYVAVPEGQNKKSKYHSKHKAHLNDIHS